MERDRHRERDKYHSIRDERDRSHRDRDRNEKDRDRADRKRTHRDRSRDRKSVSLLSEKYIYYAKDITGKTEVVICLSLFSLFF